MRALVVACAFAVAVASAPAAASVKSCVNQPNGTSCTSDCQINGVCAEGTCVNGKAAKDGTPCASGNACTVNDACLAGVCQPGGPRVCPKLPCSSVICDPNQGCVYVYTCDMAPPSDLAPSPDLALSASDLASAADLASLPTTGDLGATSDLAAAHADGAASPDLARIVPAADGGSDGAPPEEAWLHAHGSGCSCAVAPGDDGGRDGTLALVLLGIVAAAIARRRDQ